MLYSEKMPVQRSVETAESEDRPLAPYELKHRELRILKGTNSYSISLNIGAATIIRGIKARERPEGLVATTRFSLRSTFNPGDAGRFIPLMEPRIQRLSRASITACILRGGRSTRRNNEAEMEPASTDEPNTLRVEVFRLRYPEGVVYVRALFVSGLWIGYEEDLLVLDHEHADWGRH